MEKEAPLRELLPIVGYRKPLLRSLLSGNDSQGRYRIGTPSKLTVAERASPTRAAVSSRTLFARICHTSSVFGQVVNRTPFRSITPCGVSCSASAEPRAARCRRSNVADRKLAPSLGE